MTSHLRGITTGTPVPLTERETQDARSFVSTEQWGPERVAKYLAETYGDMKNPRRVTDHRVYQLQRKEDEDMATVIDMTKEEYLAERLAGKNRAQIANELGLKHQAYLYPQLEKWSIKAKVDEDAALRALGIESTVAQEVEDSNDWAELSTVIEEEKTAPEDASEQPEEPTSKPTEKQEDKTENTIVSEAESEASSDAQEASGEVIGYITIRIPVKPSTIDAHCERTDRVNIGVSMLQSTINEVFAELNDILGPADYTHQIERFIERKIAEMV